MFFWDEGKGINVLSLSAIRRWSWRVANVRYSLIWSLRVNGQFDFGKLESGVLIRNRGLTPTRYNYFIRIISLVCRETVRSKLFHNMRLCEFQEYRCICHITVLRRLSLKAILQNCKKMKAFHKKSATCSGIVILYIDKRRLFEVL